MGMSNTLNAGELDRRIVLQRSVTTTDAFNTPKADWIDHASVRAAKEDVSDAERSRAEETTTVIGTRFRIRWSGDVAAVEADQTWRVNFGDRLYNIVAVKEIGRRVGLELSCMARAETPAP